jgi:hypothetical protein
MRLTSGTDSPFSMREGRKSAGNAPHTSDPTCHTLRYRELMAYAFYKANYRPPARVAKPGER